MDGSASISSGGVKHYRGLDYSEEEARCLEFLREYQGPYGSESSEPKYKRQLQDVANRESRILEIELDDIVDYCDGDEALAYSVQTNTRRYVEIFYKAADSLLPESDNLAQEDDVFDILVQQRMTVDGNDEGITSDAKNKVPPALSRRYEIVIKPRAKDQPLALRNVKASNVGELTTVKGLVTRVTDVRPLISVATYTCDTCGFEIYQHVSSRQFMPLSQCESAVCKENNARGQLHLQTRGSRFVKFQVAKLQEMADQVPHGHVPRSMTVHLTGELTRKLTAGDVVAVSGIFLPVPYSGYRALRAGLIADTYMDAMYIRQLKKSGMETGHVVSQEVEEVIENLVEEGQVYERLSQSIAPEIFGHEDIKKVLLLLLVGGVSRTLSDSIKMRGDIHVCLMGDPGVAKSQLLKHVCKTTPRSVYTTGRGSSGVGLTAAVHKDPVTNEFVLEGGAVVLADRGICCIDEFDKMEESDRTAIHEVMEQQTVSIAKAGITTTLNARTSILAAANPVYGRWDIRKTPAQNIGFPASLLSRFDIMWVLRDIPDRDADSLLAQHVLHVHKALAAPESSVPTLSSEVLREYIARSKHYEPSFPKSLTEYIATLYATLRRGGERESDDSDSGHHVANNRGEFVTARTLLSILRISQALARLRQSNQVSQDDVQEALRLHELSKESLTVSSDGSIYGNEAEQVDEISQVYSIIREIAQRSNKSFIKYSDAKEAVSKKGFSFEALDNCLNEYSKLNIWQLNPTTSDITLVT